MSRFAQGKFPLKNPEKYVGGRTPTYRSSWEFHFMKFCDEHPSISQWASEAIRIPYRNPFSGKHTIYVPDFFIVYTDANSKQRVEIIEVKPANQTIKEKTGRSKHNQAHWVLNQAKWEAARSYCKQKGILFRIITEGEMFHQGKRR
jgi:hypothetical protein